MFIPDYSVTLQPYHTSVAPVHRQLWSIDHIFWWLWAGMFIPINTSPASSVGPEHTLQRAWGGACRWVFGTGTPGETLSALRSLSRGSGQRGPIQRKIRHAQMPLKSTKFRYVTAHFHYIYSIGIQVQVILLDCTQLVYKYLKFHMTHYLDTSGKVWFQNKGGNVCYWSYTI